MPRYLTDKDIADFRSELCKVATERFARFGYEGVTMRQLAELNFALKNPHAYRIMFDLEAPIDEKHPELRPQAERAARHITRGAEEMAKGGIIDTDPAMFGYAFWAALHGIVMLHQSGMLTHGPDYKKLSAFLGTTMLKGAKGNKR